MRGGVVAIGVSGAETEEVAVMENFQEWLWKQVGQ